MFHHLHQLYLSAVTGQALYTAGLSELFPEKRSLLRREVTLMRDARMDQNTKVALSMGLPP